MMSKAFLLGLVALLLNSSAICASMISNFSEFFQTNWAADHIVSQGDQTQLTLDNVSGCGFQSTRKYLFGKVSVQIKLVEGDSAGTVTAFYMSSEGPNRDELDFEFLGNVSGEPYLVQTNVYVNGTGNREQRHSLWFDPTADFHAYSFFWNRHSIVFLVDNIPIRVFENKEEDGVGYPRSQAMGIRGSVWNADDWATQGGRVKTNWSNAPFVSTFRSFEIEGCELPEDTDDTVFVAKCDKLGQFWWDKPSFRGLNRHKTHQLKWVRSKYLVYDYCKDTVRFTELPRECVNTWVAELQDILTGIINQLGTDNLDNLRKLAEQFQKQAPGAGDGATAAQEDDDDEVLELVAGETFEAAAEETKTA